ncbi:MAG: hypothetical protein IPN83_26870 [Holophagales bacterium]|nr:hypothetical protein [Holophagales bacterium]
MQSRCRPSQPRTPAEPLRRVDCRSLRRCTLAHGRRALSAAKLRLVLAALAGTAGCSSLVDGLSGRKEACEILAIGTPATATITRLVDTGTTINDDPVVEFVLRVVTAEGEAYEARTRALVSRLDVPAVQPGRVVPVRYDPANREHLALDLWECPGKK